MKNTFTAEDKIYEQVKDLESGLAVTYGNTTYIGHDVVKGYFIQRYGDFFCSDILTKFQIFQSIHNADFAKAFDAFTTEYDPFSDVNLTETRAILDNHGKNTDTRKTDSTHNKVTAEALNGTKTETYTTTDDSDTPRLETRDTSTGGTQTTDDLWTTNEKTRENTSLTLDGFEYTAHDVRGERVHKEGDSGGKMPQEMLEAERNARLNPVQKNYLDLFIYTNASYIGGAWS